MPPELTADLKPTVDSAPVSEVVGLLEDATIKLYAYCRRNSWSGFDPFDGLNSRLFGMLPFVQNRMGRLLFTQVLKRLPFNLRPFLLVQKSGNPKGLAVFCTALLILSDAGLIKDDDQILHLINRLCELRSPNSPYFCWGYNFDWQSRNLLLPKYSPNVICTTFVGNALLDAFLRYKDSRYLEMAISAGQFILNGLNVSVISANEICFSYTMFDHEKVHNANLLGAAYLARLYKITGDRSYFEPSYKCARYSVNRQFKDGSWLYGEEKTQAWIDNFHTGYNLCALKAIGEYLDTGEFESSINLGFDFYVKNFFQPDGAPKYFHNRVYPIDIHSVAQSIITLIEFCDNEENAVKVADSVFKWAMNNMWNEQGYFYYQVTPFYKNKIPYMRWSQSWMLYAMAKLLAKKVEKTPAVYNESSRRRDAIHWVNGGEIR